MQGTQQNLVEVYFFVIALDVNSLFLLIIALSHKSWLQKYILHLLLVFAFLVFSSMLYTVYSVGLNKANIV